MTAQLSFISPRPLQQSSRPFHSQHELSPRSQTTPGSHTPSNSNLGRLQAHAAVALDQTAINRTPTKVRVSKALMPMTQNLTKSPASTKVVRTVPRSRHSRSTSPVDSGADEMRHEPYTTTAQGFPVNNKIKKAKYATSIDERGYLAVYEFQLNDQTIMWDYTSGFVHLTGIWKALGNSKADIVRLVDNHPELEGVIRRIRGGFLKIQGTWVPFELCKRLALRTCYSIRHALISVFGPDFPEECLKPDAKGYGTLTLDDSGIDKKRKKRKIHVVEATEDQRIRTADALNTSERVKRPRTAHQVRPRSNSLSSSEAGSLSTPSQLSQKTSPPPLPRVLELTEGGYYAYTDLLDLLRATRSLQKLSSGDSTDWSDEGGLFNLSGSDATFHWDGNDHLELLPTTPPTSSQAKSRMSEHALETSWKQAPSMSRKFSTASTNQFSSSSSTNGPITPPLSYNAIPVTIAASSPVSNNNPYLPYASPDSNWSVRDLAYTSTGKINNVVKTSGINILGDW